MGLTVHHLPLGDEAGPAPASWAIHGVDLDREPAMRPSGWSEDLQFNGVKGPGLRSPLTMWYINGGKTKVVVDTGCPHHDRDSRAAQAIARMNGFALWTEHRDEWTVENQLARFGITPADIDVVINTCLHFDHIGNNTLFTNATIIVQRSEIPYAVAPPRWAQFYFPEFAYNIVDVRDRLMAIEGDLRVTDEISVVHLGGHTPGTQVVLIDTDVGRVCLPGDLVPFYKNLELNCPSGAFFDLPAVARAYQWMRSNADLILPHHDWGFFERYPDGAVGAGVGERDGSYERRVS